ncbi:10732_t:CDS:1, partial [Cetraspora pellucida]
LICNIDEYAYTIDQPTATKDVLTDKGIIEMIINKFNNDDDETDDNKRSLPPSLITITDAINALKKLLIFKKVLNLEK